MAVQTVGQLKVDLKADIADFRRDMKAATGVFKKNTTAMQRTAKRFKTVIAGAFAGFGLFYGAQAVRAFVANTTKQQNAMAQVTAAIKSTGSAAGLTSKEIFKMASEMQKLTTFGDEDVLSMQAILLTFTKIGKDVFPQATKAVLDMSVRLGQDLKSAAIQVGKALNDPIKGVTALGRAGVQFTDAQKDMIRVMVEAGDVSKAQGVILNELKTQFEGAAEAARGTLGGEITALKNNIGDLFELDSEAAKPLINALKDINQNFETIAKSVGTVFRGVTGFFGGINEFTMRLAEANYEAVFGLKGGTLTNERRQREQAKIDLQLSPITAKGNFGASPNSTPKKPEEIKKATEEVKKAVELTRFEMEDLLRATREWKNGAVVAFAQYADAATDAFSNVHDFGIRRLNSLEDTLTNFLDTGKFGFRELANSAISDLNRIAIRQNITGPLASFLGQSSFFGGSSKLFNFGGAMAGGGNVSPGAAFLVGERGPEMFVPDVSGAIVPNGGGSISFGDIIIQGSVDQESAMRSAAQVQEELALAMREAQRSM